MCIIALSFTAVGCGEKEEKPNYKNLSQPPADEKDEKTKNKDFWKEIQKDLDEDEDFNARIQDIKNSKEYTDEEKEILVKRLIENDIRRKKYKKILDERYPERKRK
jgi:hypothetical protein